MATKRKPKVFQKKSAQKIVDEIKQERRDAENKEQEVIATTVEVEKTIETITQDVLKDTSEKEPQVVQEEKTEEKAEDKPEDETHEEVSDASSSEDSAKPEENDVIEEKKDIVTPGAFFDTPPDISRSSSSRKSMVWLFIPVFLLTVAIVSGLLIYLETVKKGTAKKETTPVVIEKVATPTPEAVDLSRYSIEVLNASGVRGVAAELAETLEGKGFVVSSTGNAESESDASVIVAAKEDVDEAYIDELTSVLEETYDVVETETLPESETVDVVITIVNE